MLTLTIPWCRHVGPAPADVQAWLGPPSRILAWRSQKANSVSQAFRPSLGVEMPSA